MPALYFCGKIIKQMFEALQPREEFKMGEATNELDKALTFEAYRPERGTIYFTGKTHHKFYNKIKKRAAVRGEDRHKFALLYILSSIEKFRKNPARFLFLNNLKPNPQAFREGLPHGEQSLVQLAFSLYTERPIFRIGVMDLFNNLSNEEALIAIDAIKLKFDIKIYRS